MSFLERIIAKSEVKLELEALSDKMTDKDQYVIFTKTKELKYDKVLHERDDGGRLLCSCHPTSKH